MDSIERREIELKIVEIIKFHHLSLNQADEILDSVKYILTKKPLWD